VTTNRTRRPFVWSVIGAVSLAERHGVGVVGVHTDRQVDKTASLSASRTGAGISV
jgi:hypothetical protein